ncbi:MAG: preprotein translocase subunit SecY [Rickettsiales bacterium]|nr:preprotein translocase subunit SecY [Rickettsiales bacterium]
MASNINLSVIGKAEELKKRLLFVIGALIIYRLGTYIPLPGVDSRVLDKMFSMHSQGILGIFDMFSGGALSRMTIFALNVMPYITVSIVVQLVTVIYPALNQLRKEGGEAGRRKIQQYTRIGTVFMTAIQGYGIATYLQSINIDGQTAIINPGLFFTITTITTLIGGTLFLMWLGEQITSRGIGNGVSLIIFAGIVANLPSAISKTFELGRTGAISTGFIILIVALIVAMIAFIVFMERAQRRLIVQYPKRMVGNKQYQGESTYLPLKINTAGVLPPIFASSLLLFPATLSGFGVGGAGADQNEIIQTILLYLGHGKPLYILLYILMIVFFCFFYMNNVFNPVETADNLKKNGGFIPGIRPGKNTGDYLQFILNRITVIGAAYLSLICVIPELLVAEFAVPFYLGGTSLLIVVNVTMDTIAQIHSHLIAHQYEGLLKKTNLKGGRRRK